MAEQYQKGNYVSYSTNGICRIDDIRQEAGIGKEPPKTYYILKPAADPGSTIFVPTTSPVLLAKMQKLPTREEVNAMILATLENNIPWEEDRKLRSAQFQVILKACDLKDLLRLVSCIYQKGQDLAARGKKLAASDEAVLRRAEGLIENELSFILELDKNQVGTYIQNKLSI